TGLVNLTYSVDDYESFSPGLPADAVLFYDSLHHAEEPALAVRGAAASLKPGGMMIAFEPGDGHHDTDRAKELIAEFGVHENDMPARRIIALGRAAGMSRHLCLPFPWTTFRHLYRPGYANGTSSGDLRGKYRL